MLQPNESLDTMDKAAAKIELPKLKNFKMMDIQSGRVTTNFFKGQELLRKLKGIDEREVESITE